MKNVSNAKYVVETCYNNGNEFLHGPFRSKTAAENWILKSEDTKQKNCNKVTVRMILAPTGWTRSVK